MSREARVRFWERVGVRLPCATRQVVTDTLGLLVGAESTPLMCKIAVVPGSSSAPSTICFLGCVICLPTAPTLVVGSTMRWPGLAIGRSRWLDAAPRSPALPCCRGAGWSSAHWLGSTETAAWQKISKPRSLD